MQRIPCKQHSKRQHNKTLSTLLRPLKMILLGRLAQHIIDANHPTSSQPTSSSSFPLTEIRFSTAIALPTKPQPKICQLRELLVLYASCQKPECLQAKATPFAVASLTGDFTSCFVPLFCPASGTPKISYGILESLPL